MARLLRATIQALGALIERGKAADREAEGCEWRPNICPACAYPEHGRACIGWPAPGFNAKGQRRKEGWTAPKSGGYSATPLRGPKPPPPKGPGV